MLLIDALPRSKKGKSVSRCLRKEGLVPAIIYGGGAEVQFITLKDKEIAKALETPSSLTGLVKVSVESNTQRVIIKELQRHPTSGKIIHIDFQRVQGDKAITTRIPLKFINASQSEGVKNQGGRLSIEAKLAEIRCLPENLPETLVVDVIRGRLNDIFYLSDAQLPDGVSLVPLFKGKKHNQAIGRIGKAKI